jgi:hypothetical protein
MRIAMSWTHGSHAFFVLAASAVLTGVASCVSGDEAPAGGRIEHPPARIPMPLASAEAPQDASPPAEGSFTPLDVAIAHDCGPGGFRTWSQNVPDRDCTTDGECGDGFCDRGHCAAIKTCVYRYGQRCINGRTAPGGKAYGQTECIGTCFEGRCRSCVSDEECVEEYRKRDLSHPVPGAYCRRFPPGVGNICTFRWGGHAIDP